MADYTDIFGNVITAAGGIGGNILQSNALQGAQNALSQSYGTAGQYIQGGKQEALGYASPYMTAGVNAMQPYMTAAQTVGSPLTMQQYQQGPYGQVANAAQKQVADQLMASASAQGMYGSGNMANALQQNAMNTQLQMYDTAAQRELQRQQAAMTARYSPVALGQASAAQMGGYATDASKYMAGLAQNQGLVNAQALQGQAGYGSSILNTIAQAGKNLLGGYVGTPTTNTYLNPTATLQADMAYASNPANYSEANLQAFREMYPEYNWTTAQNSQGQNIIVPGGPSEMGLGVSYNPMDYLAYDTASFTPMSTSDYYTWNPASYTDTTTSPDYITQY